MYTLGACQLIELFYDYISTEHNQSWFAILKDPVDCACMCEQSFTVFMSFCLIAAQ